MVSSIFPNLIRSILRQPSKQSSLERESKVLRDEIIELEYHPEDSNGKRQMKVLKQIQLRKVCYQDEQNRYYEFLTNSFDITAEEVAFLYKRRWGIELL